MEMMAGRYSAVRLFFFLTMVRIFDDLATSHCRAKKSAPRAFWQLLAACLAVGALVVSLVIELIVQQHPAGGLQSELVAGS